MIPRLFYLCLMANLKLYVFFVFDDFGIFFLTLVLSSSCGKRVPAFSIPFNGPHRAVSLWAEEQISSSQGLVQKEISLKKGGSPSPSPSMFRFTYLSSAVGGNLLLGHLCQDDDSPPHRHNSCISFSLLLIFLHRHHPKQSRGCKREEISCFFIRSQACLFLGDFCSFRKCN